MKVTQKFELEGSEGLWREGYRDQEMGVRVNLEIRAREFNLGGLGFKVNKVRSRDVS